jgi:hypothetical protein
VAVAKRRPGPVRWQLCFRIVFALTSAVATLFLQSIDADSQLRSYGHGDPGHRLWGAQPCQVRRQSHASQFSGLNDVCT